MPSDPQSSIQNSQPQRRQEGRRVVLTQADIARLAHPAAPAPLRPRAEGAQANRNRQGTFNLFEGAMHPPAPRNPQHREAPTNTNTQDGPRPSAPGGGAPSL